MFLIGILNQTENVTSARKAKTMSTSHLKECIMKQENYDFLKDLVINEPDCEPLSDDSTSSNKEKISRKRSSSMTSSTTCSGKALPKKIQNVAQVTLARQAAPIYSRLKAKRCKRSSYIASSPSVTSSSTAGYSGGSGPTEESHLSSVTSSSANEDDDVTSDDVLRVAESPKQSRHHRLMTSPEGAIDLTVAKSTINGVTTSQLTSSETTRVDDVIKDDTISTQPMTSPPPNLHPLIIRKLVDDEDDDYDI